MKYYTVPATPITHQFKEFATAAAVNILTSYGYMASLHVNTLV